jgi:hypothetical protein
MKYKHKSKIFITGAIGTGTTALVKLLHELGYDTGFSSKEVHSTYRGLQWLDTRQCGRVKRKREREELDDSPHVIKSVIDYGIDELDHPCTIFDNIRYTLAMPKLEWGTDFMIITMRDLDSIQRSSEIHKVYETVWKKRQENWNLSDNIQNIRDWAAVGYYNTIREAQSLMLPVMFLEFPRYMDDLNYLYSILVWSCLPEGVDREELFNICNKLFKKELIHVR